MFKEPAWCEYQKKLRPLRLYVRRQEQTLNFLKWRHQIPWNSIVSRISSQLTIMSHDLLWYNQLLRGMALRPGTNHGSSRPLGYARSPIKPIHWPITKEINFAREQGTPISSGDYVLIGRPLRKLTRHEPQEARHQWQLCWFLLPDCSCSQISCCLSYPEAECAGEAVAKTTINANSYLKRQIRAIVCSNPTPSTSMISASQVAQHYFLKLGWVTAVSLDTTVTSSVPCVNGVKS